MNISSPLLSLVKGYDTVQTNLCYKENECELG